MSVLNVKNIYHVRVIIESSTTTYVRDATNTDVPNEHVLHKFIANHIDVDWPFAGSILTSTKAKVCLNCKGRVYAKPSIGNIGVIKTIAKQLGMEVKVMVCSEEGCITVHGKDNDLYKEDRSQGFYWS